MPVLKDAQFIGIITSMAAQRKTDVYAFAQRSQLFPTPRDYCCADSQILTHSATAFEEYFPPSPSYSVRKRKKCYLECAPLEINLFQSDLHWFNPKGFYDRCAKGCNYLYLYFRLCCCWGPEVRHKVEVAQKRSSDTRDDDRGKSSLRPNPALSSVPASHVKTGFK